MSPNPYIDQIGLRLNHPELVPPEYRHLVPDDVQRVERILSIPVHGRVLDVGCSDGAITRRIAAKWDVCASGADIHPPQTWCTSSGPVNEPYWFNWDAREPWPYIEADFNAAYACEVFEHLTDADADKALTNILNVLKPGGDLIVTTPNRYPNDLYEVGMRSRWAWPDHRSAWTATKLYVFLAPYFTGLRAIPVYDHELPDQSIWLIVHAQGRR